MADLVELQARLDTLKAARDTGVLSIRDGEVWTTYRSLGELTRIIDQLSAEIDAVTGTTPSRKPIYIRQSTKGY